jgi:hypothetical protein
MFPEEFLNNEYQNGFSISNALDILDLLRH